MSFRLRRQPRGPKLEPLQSTTKDAFTHGDGTVDGSFRAKGARLRRIRLDPEPSQRQSRSWYKQGQGRQRHYREPIPETPTIQPTCCEIKILLGPQTRKPQKIEDGILNRDAEESSVGRQKQNHIRNRVSASSAPETTGYTTQAVSPLQAQGGTRATHSQSHSLFADDTGRVRRVVRRSKATRPSSGLADRGRQSAHKSPRGPSPFSKAGHPSQDTPSAIPWIAPSDQLRAYCAASGLYGKELYRKELYGRDVQGKEVYGRGLGTVGESPMSMGQTGQHTPEPPTSRYGSLYGGALNPRGGFDSSVASPYKPTPRESSSRSFQGNARSFPGPFGKSKFSPSPFSAPGPAQAPKPTSPELRPLKSSKAVPTGMGPSFPSEPARFLGFDSKPCSPPDVTPTWRSPQNSLRGGEGVGGRRGAGGGGVGERGAGGGGWGGSGVTAGPGLQGGAGGRAGEGRGAHASGRQAGGNVVDSLVGRMLVNTGEEAPTQPMGPAVHTTVADGMVGMFASQSKERGGNRRGSRGTWGNKARGGAGMSMGGGTSVGRGTSSTASSRLQEQLARVEAKDRSLGLRRFDFDSTQLTNQRSTEVNAVGRQQWAAGRPSQPGPLHASGLVHQNQARNPHVNPPLAGADSYDFGGGQNPNSNPRPQGGVGRYESGGFSAATSAPESPSVAGSRGSTHPFISAQAQSSADKVMSWQDAFVPEPGRHGVPHGVPQRSPLREGLVEEEEEGEEEEKGEEEEEEEELGDSTSSDSDIVVPRGKPQGVLPRGQHTGPSHGALDVSSPAQPMQVASSAETSHQEPPLPENGRRGVAVPKFGEWRARGLTRTFSSRFEGLREQRQKAGGGTMAAGA